MKIIDMIGQPCPMPVIESKKALSEPGGNSVVIMVDNLTAVQNLEKMALGNNYKFSYTEKEKDCYQVSIEKKAEAASLVLEKSAGVNASLLSQDTQADGLVVAIGKNAMGEGNKELGETLIKGFIYSLTELPSLPKVVIFFNSGVYLTADGANTISDLKKLEEKGTQILSCGTCLNYYQLQEKLAVGQVADMYKITETMSAANKLLNL